MLAAFAMTAGAVGMFYEKDTTAFAILTGTILTGYGFTRSKFASNNEESK